MTNQLKLTLMDNASGVAVGFLALEPLCITIIFVAYFWAARKHIVADKRQNAHTDIILGSAYLIYGLFKVGYLFLPSA